MKHTAQLEPSIGKAQVGEDDAGAFSRGDTATVVHVRRFSGTGLSVKTCDGAAQPCDFNVAEILQYSC